MALFVCSGAVIHDGVVYDTGEFRIVLHRGASWQECRMRRRLAVFHALQWMACHE